jgi:hypothetical protein
MGYLFIELIFDSRLIFYANFSKLNKQGIQFMIFRRRLRKLLEEIYVIAFSAWRRIQLESIGRIYKTPRILDRRITLPRYEGPIRQLSIMDLGHEEFTLLIINQLHRAFFKLIERYV